MTVFHWKPSTSSYKYLSIHTSWPSATQHSDMPNSAGTTHPKSLQHNTSQTLRTSATQHITNLNTYQYSDILARSGSCAEYHCKSQNHRAALDSPRHLSAALRLDPVARASLSARSDSESLGPARLWATLNSKSTRPGLLWGALDSPRPALGPT